MTQLSLKERAFKGAFWTIGGTVYGQILRLLSNLILTRLLFPEAFGLMALVQVFMVGVNQFTELGINASIIQNKRRDQDFLNTAWTLQVIRGFIVWIAICLIAWPVSIFYGEDILLPLLIVAGFSAIIMSFMATKVVVANRKLELRKIAITEIVSSSIGTIFSVVGAWMTQSIWALVIGGLIYSIVKLALSYFYFEGANNKFCWDKKAVHSIYKFGRWLLLSSVLTFLAAQGDRLIIGRMFNVEFLGIYTIAIALVAAAYMFTQKLGSAVFFPSYSEIAREKPERLYYVLRKARIAQIAILLPIAVALIFFGKDIINLLYDDRYSKAGWMLEITALGMLIGGLRSSYTGVLVAIGKTGVSTLLLSITVVVKSAAMLIGGYYWGELGMLIGLALTSSIIFSFDAIVYSKYSLWQPEIDLPIFVVSACIMMFYFSDYFL